MHILLIDNYDSFTYNLVQYLQQAGARVTVKLNDEVSLEDIESMEIDGIVFSPGPGTPLKKEDVGVCADVVSGMSGKIPLLGVCLGHQLIGALHGGTVMRTEPKHGEVSVVTQTGESLLFKDLSEQFDVMRYHSLIVEKDGFPADLKITAETEDGIVMACEHAEHSTYGVQFHPESIGTAVGQKIIDNFVAICGESA